MTHPIMRMLDDVAAGRFASSDGSVEVHTQPPGRSAAVLSFSGHHVIAADVSPDWVREHIDDTDIGAAMKPPFLTSIGDLLRRRTGAFDVVLVASGEAGRPALDLVPLDGEHLRVTRAHRHRTDVRAYGVDAIPEAVVLVGRGFADRWEIAFEVPPAERGRGLGRTLVDAARHLVPLGEPVWAQVSPGNAASLRAVLSAGYVPVGSEVLFPAESPN